MSHSRSIFITAETHQHLLKKKEILGRKIDEARKELSSLVREEKDSLGNHPLMIAQNEIGLLEGQIVELDETLSNASIVKKRCDAIVAIGSRITVSMNHGEGIEKELEFLIDGVCECVDTGINILTPGSPVGAAVIGAKAGDKRECVAPNGNVISIVIIAVC